MIDEKIESVRVMTEYKLTRVCEPTEEEPNPGRPLEFHLALRFSPGRPINAVA